MSNPIEHVIIIVKENHTFDNYFGTFPGANGVVLPAEPDPIPDPLHDHGAWLSAQSHGGGLQEQYKRDDIPAYWAYAQQYTLCDNYFTDVASQSEPNHLHLIAATSPIIDNSTKHRFYQPMPPYDLKSLPATLESAGMSWRNYASPRSSYFDHISALAGHPWNVPVGQFDLDVAAGSLAHVAWLYAPDGLSEHPGDHGGPVVKPGMEWTVARVGAVAASPLWANTAIFITWDDWGGNADSVKPRRLSNWPGGGPKGYRNSQFRYGPRVPCLVLSPYAKQGINSNFYSHVSIVKFCLRLFGLQRWDVPALAPNDPSGDMWEGFDFNAAPRLGPPSTEPSGNSNTSRQRRHR